MKSTSTTVRGLAPSPPPPARARRGALLLLVLSVLMLFMMIGTLMLALAMRARSTARAFADAVAGSGNRAATARGMLDEALMTLVRGTAPPAGGAAPARESLLADRYGLSHLEGKLTAITTATGPVLRVSVTLTNPPPPLQLAGRILTIKPRETDSAPITSFRILSVNGQTFELANLRTVGVRPLPASTELPCDVFVNGREFADTAGNESSDAFDGANAFLTQASAQGSSASIGRPAYPVAPGGAAPLDVDNDGDGVADGIWISNLFPTQADGSTTKVSFLVLDLGGRINVNAHGTVVANPGSGPAAVDGSALFTETGVWDRMLQGWSSPTAPQPAATGSRRSAPALGSGLEGRFGGGPANTYALRLDFDGPRPASRTAAAGNVFTCGELEWVLRPFDADTSALPPRLAALLGNSAEVARMLITTDSWDTCGLVGSLANKIATAANAADLPADVREGLRCNLGDRDLTDPAAKQKLFEDLLAVVVAAGAPANAITDQWVANVVDFIDADTTADSYQKPGGGSLTGVEPSTLPAAFRDALPVKDPGSFESPALLLAVPPGTKAQIELALNPPPPLTPQPIVSLAVAHPEILDAVTVASPFQSTVFVTAGGRKLCRWREPGRINVNTCDDKAWNGLTGASVPNPFKGSPAKSPSEVLLGVPQVFTAPDRDVRTLNPGLANRLANIATTRSDVFAVWITLEWTPAGTNPVPTYHRLFAIVDRSIPVGHAAGQDLNARDTIRVVRHLE